MEGGSGTERAKLVKGHFCLKRGIILADRISGYNVFKIRKRQTYE